jgi:protein ImuB
MLWLALRLPDLPLEVYARAQSLDDAILPFAVTSGGSRPQIVVANGAARAAGVKRGQPVAGALALAPSIVLRERDEPAEAAALEAVATWAIGFTPTVSLAPPRAVLAEIGGSRKLFGGLPPLVEAIARGLRERGHAARLAIAPTPLGADILARIGHEAPVTTPGALRDALAGAPLGALDLDAKLLATLAAAGVRTIGAADALPRDGLARRFGDALVSALDRAHGRRPDPRLPWTPPPVFAGKLALPAPAHDAEALGFAARRLAQELAAWLNARGLGVTRFTLALVHERWQHARVGGRRRRSSCRSPRPHARSRTSRPC